MESKMKVIFKPKTPIFIASGEQYYPNDYYIDEENYICFIDRKKFNEKIKEKGLFEEFIKKSEDIENLLEFIDENVEESVYKEKVLTTSNIADELLESYSRPIEAFIKDKFYFAPIIPGSSIKGVVRTALLDYILHRDFDIEELKKYKEKELQTIVFCNENKNKNGKLQFDAKKDILKALFIEDFKPKSYKLKIIKPRNRPYKGKKDNTIPVILESLVEGEFEGEIRIEEFLLQNDKDLASNKFFKTEPLTIELIKKALREFYKKIYNIESKRFRVRLPKYNENLMKIGKYSGAGSKSLHDLRSIYIRPLKKNFDYQLSVWIDEYENPLGWGELKFER
jgi:CRISPR-associated protein Csm5